MNDLREQENIEALIQRFFAAFDNRNGQIPRQDLMTELFAERAIIATHHDGNCELYSPKPAYISAQSTRAAAPSFFNSLNLHRAGAL